MIDIAVLYTAAQYYNMPLAGCTVAGGQVKSSDIIRRRRHVLQYVSVRDDRSRICCSASIDNIFIFDRPAISFFGFVFHRRRRRGVVSKQNVAIGRVSTRVYKRILPLHAAITIVVRHNIICIYYCTVV